MGDTKETQVHRGLKITRIVTALLTGILFAVAMTQIVINPSIKISFNTGTDAQQLSSIKIKKGSSVELPTPLKPGSYFLGWSLSPDSPEFLEDSTELVKDTTLYAVWDGAEKYAVLSVNGIPYNEVNIFDTSVEGLTPAQLNQEWRVLDDYAADNQRRTYFSGVLVDPNNNFSRFLGWKYLNAYGLYNDLLYEADATGLAGTWTLVQRDVNGNETRSVISDTNKFYPPNYRTTFTAILDYRTIYIELYDKGANVSYNTKIAKLGEANVTLPVYENNPTAHFSHWEIETGRFKNVYANEANQPALAAFVNNVKKRYASGEVLETLDPFWYYYGSDLKLANSTSNELVLTLTLRAVYWDDEKVDRYSMQAFTDLDSGTQYVNFADVGYNDLSLTQPVGYERLDNNNCVWLYLDDKILSYAFYDHEGVYHELTTSSLKTITKDKAYGITIGERVTVPNQNQKIYFKEEWGINIVVNYQTAAADITVKFNYGDDLYLLPNYRHYDTSSITTYTRKIGNSFVMPTGENYMKTDYIFTGWQLVGDDSERLYYAGETFTIPNLDTSKQQTTIEFVAVWHLQRLLFNFNFMGGDWENEDGPDFTLMKGAYDHCVRIVTDIPVKFGYDFIGWTLEKSTYDPAEDKLFQPGDDIIVGKKIQTLYAQWKPRRLRVVFYNRIDEANWSYSDPIEEDFDGGALCSGGYVETPTLPNSGITNWYTFDGWQVGNDTYNMGYKLQLTTEILSQLETVERPDGDGIILEVNIYAKQTKRTVDVAAYTYEDDTVKIDASKFATVLTQGELFFNYYPFSAIKDKGSYAEFDSNGKQFTGWSYRVGTTGSWTPINADTKVPSGVKESIYILGGFSVQKTIRVEYYDYQGNYLQSDARDSLTFGAVVNLIDRNNLGKLPTEIDGWGTFVGWSIEPDHQAGNPDIIYDVYYANGPQLELSNQVDSTSTPYLIDVDRYATQNYDLNYTLKLYAVYATNYAEIKYTYLKDQTGAQDTKLQFPVYSTAQMTKGQYNQTTLGGSTVGYNSKDFKDYGLTVLDDSTLEVMSGENFIGWKANLPAGVSSAVREVFENKIWFPGEYLPSIDFNFEFYPIYLMQNDEVREIEVGNRTYRVLSLRNGTTAFKFDGSVDIVAFPRGEYTLKQNSVIINSDREVHVVISAYSKKISLEPRAIQCNTITEFYVGENLNITGSPVVGANFQFYRIQKGYRLMDEDGKPTTVLNASGKYDFAASMLGLLVSRNHKVLYGVPSHVNLTTDELYQVITSYDVIQIAEYALADINNLATINLAKSSNLQIDANAIFNVTASRIILPGSAEVDDSLVVSPQALSGALTNLKAVTFGDTTNVHTWYAFVENNIVYYVDEIDGVRIPDQKTHVMYVLPAVELKPLAYSINNLEFDANVNIIEPYALMGLNWTKINSIMAMNQFVDLRNLQGIPDNIPLFTSAQNENKGPMIQPYEKTFIFKCYGYDSITVPFKYGQTFTVFSAQNNNYQFKFDKAYSQFVGWKAHGKIFRVGEVYKVGISEEITWDDYQLEFDASGTDCWTAFPVWFHIYNGKTEEAYTPNALYDIDGVAYTMDALLKNYNALDEIYLPGLDQRYMTSDGSIYQFVGWSTIATSSHLWNDVAVEYRILPNHTTSTFLNCGNGVPYGSINIYSYYALYEKVTLSLEYTLLSDGTYAVSGFRNTNFTSLNIPFAKYNEGYMVPISKINDGVFNGITNMNNSQTTLSEIVIGGAVSEIGQYAFYNVNAIQIKFAHKGLSIYYNYRQNTAVRQLTIGVNAFAQNDKMTELVLPDALESLADGAFRSCTNLVKVTFASGTPYLRNLGDFVFRDDVSMTNNAVVNLLINDGKNGVNRFVKVGAGIFMNTNITNVNDSNGNPISKIVWRDTVLHVFYINGQNRELNFTESKIAGYAFVNAGSTDSNVKMTIRFSNTNVVIQDYAFTNLHTSITIIDLKSAPVRPANVSLKAFDDTVKHAVTVTTSNLANWESYGFKKVGGFTFTN